MLEEIALTVISIICGLYYKILKWLKRCRIPFYWSMCIVIPFSLVFKIEFNSDMTGIFITSSVARIILVIFSLALFRKGLREKNPRYTIPVIVLTLCYLFVVQFTFITNNFYEVLDLYLHSSSPKHQRIFYAFCTYVMIFGCRVVLTVYAGYLSLKQYFS